jgi:hypothetical protein
MICRTSARIVFAFSFISLGMTNAVAQDTQIYKCARPNGGILYTDQACNCGKVLDIRLDPVDPNALARLARAPAELDAAEAQRRAEQARLDELNQVQQQQMESEQYAGVPFAGDGNYVDDEPWYGSFDGYGHHDGYPYHRGLARDDHERMSRENRAIGSGVLERAAPGRR